MTPADDESAAVWQARVEAKLDVALAQHGMRLDHHDEKLDDHEMRMRSVESRPSWDEGRVRELEARPTLSLKAIGAAMTTVLVVIGGLLALLDRLYA